MKNVKLKQPTRSPMCSASNSRVSSIIYNDPFRFERLQYRATTLYILVLAMQLTAIVVIQLGFIFIIISFGLFAFLPFPCLSLVAHVCTVIGFYRSCTSLLIPHILIESVVAIVYFVVASLCIKDAITHPGSDQSSVFEGVPINRAIKFGVFLLIGVPFQLFFVLAVFKRYYTGPF